VAKPAEEEADDRRMPFTEHLAELRTRLRNSVLAVIIITVVAYVYSQKLLDVMITPLLYAWSHAPPEANLGKLELFFANPVDGMMVSLKLALYVGVFGASPVIFHQVWKFISPGLYTRERRLALPFILSSVILFFGGAMFCYKFVLPAGLKFFLGFASSSIVQLKGAVGQLPVDPNSFTIKPFFALDEYFSFTSMLLLIFGCVFELPLLLSVLAMIGLVTPRGLWRFNRYAILIFFVLGAILTPGDLVVGQIAMGGALTVLYNLSIVAALVVGKKRREQREADEAAERAAEAADG
jgi:sec-independent protein translocase protein TatC